MKKTSYLIWVFIFISLFVLLFLVSTQKRENIENIENIEKPVDLQIVIARYNEDLKWLKNEPFNQYPVVVYNKGSNEDYYHSPNIQETINVENVGRCDHTYLYHIITHYDRLSEITIFLPGSTNIDYKLSKAQNQINECVKHKNTVIVNSSYHPNGVHEELYDFQLENWTATDEKNKQSNSESKLLPAEIRPFGKWHETRFPGVFAHNVSYTGILGIHRKHILQHPKSYYENLIRELETHSNPEVGHYFERAWMSVFHPMEDAVVL